MTIIEFVDALNEKFNGFPTVAIDRLGSTYVRIVVQSPGSRSVFCFVDNDGNILKPAGWMAPAKGVRSTLATVDIGKVDPYGYWLCR
jgi:hypothetical protein